MLENLEDIAAKYLAPQWLADANKILSPAGLRLSAYDLKGRPIGNGLGAGSARSIFDDPACHAAMSIVETTRDTATIIDDGIKSRFLAPLIAEEGCVGCLLIESLGNSNASVEISRRDLVEAEIRLLSAAFNGARNTAHLTKELTERYEELNLIYATSETLDLSLDENESLGGICRAVSDTLYSDLLVLRVPSLGIVRLHPANELDIEPWQLVVSLLEACVAKARDGVAQNFLKDDETFRDAAGPFAHAIAAPFEVDTHPGTLVLLRTDPQQRYYMGDVMLLKSVARLVGVFLSNHRMIRTRRQLFDASIFGLARLAESRDPETGLHLERVSHYVRLLAVQLQKDSEYRARVTDEFIENVFRSSPLHDIGKVGVPDYILLKPGKLTAEEFELMKKHTIIGGNTIGDIERRLRWGTNTFLTLGKEIAFSHHEKWDGAGYPYGRRGEEIPLSARIMGVADVYDALTSKRCYKEPFSHEKSVAIILEESGRHFDPELVRAFQVLEQEFNRIRGEREDTAEKVMEIMK